jgi:hypothetical protein
MMEMLKTLIKQPYWIIALIVGTVLIALPYVAIDKDHFSTHPSTTIVPVITGGALLLVSVLGFGATFYLKWETDAGGLDLTPVIEDHGVLSTIVSDCEIRVIQGRLEEYPREAGTVIVLPCNEYFDDQCASDSKSALGAYVNRVFNGQVSELVSLVRTAAGKKFGAGTELQKTDEERAVSYGTGRCLLLRKPLGQPDPIALISTTRQRAGEGLVAQMSSLFQGVHELSKCLADARIHEAVMPVLGAGHGGVHTPLAFIGLLISIAEAARYGQGAQRLKRVTVIVFKRDSHSLPEVDPTIVRHGLALISDQPKKRNSGSH